MRKRYVKAYPLSWAVIVAQPDLGSEYGYLPSEHAGTVYRRSNGKYVGQHPKGAGITHEYATKAGAQNALLKRYEQNRSNNKV